MFTKIKTIAWKINVTINVEVYCGFFLIPINVDDCRFFSAVNVVSTWQPGVIRMFHAELSVEWLTWECFKIIVTCRILCALICWIPRLVTTYCTLSRHLFVRWSCQLVKVWQLHGSVKFMLQINAWLFNIIWVIHYVNTKHVLKWLVCLFTLATGCNSLSLCGVVANTWLCSSTEPR